MLRLVAILSHIVCSRAARRTGSSEALGSKEVEGSSGAQEANVYASAANRSKEVEGSSGAQEANMYAS